MDTSTREHDDKLSDQFVVIFLWPGFIWSFTFFGTLCYFQFFSLLSRSFFVQKNWWMSGRIDVGVNYNVIDVHSRPRRSLLQVISAAMTRTGFVCAIALKKVSEFTLSRLSKDPVRRERRHTLLEVHRDSLVCSLVEWERVTVAPHLVLRSYPLTPDRAGDDLIVITRAPNVVAPCKCWDKSFLSSDAGVTR